MKYGTAQQIADVFGVDLSRAEVTTFHGGDATARPHVYASYHLPDRTVRVECVPTWKDEGSVRPALCKAVIYDWERIGNDLELFGGAAARVWAEMVGGTR